MFEGFLRLGDVEIVNNARAQGYAETSDCPLNWFECSCDGLAESQGESAGYSIQNVSQAPWFDVRNPESARFYGLSGLSLRNVSDSTRYAETTEGITDGGVAGNPRRAGRSFRVRGWMSADGQDALEYGMSWLSAALISRRCAQHDFACGGASAEFFVECPPVRAVITVPGEDPGDPPVTRPQTDEEYAESVSEKLRFMHSVKVISGPLEIQTRPSQDGRHWGREVEFTLYAEEPGIFSAPRPLALLSLIHI